MSTAQSPATQPETDHIHWQGRFTSPLLEEEYRQQYLGQEVRRVTFAAIAVIVANAVFVWTDSVFFGWGRMFFGVAGIRATLFLVSVATLVVIHRKPSPRRADQMLLIWGVTIALTVVLMSATRPPNYSAHFFFGPLVVMLIFMALPIGILLQAIPTTIISVGTIVLYVTRTPFDGIGLRLLVVSLLCANVLGFAVSQELHVGKRRQFATLKRERQARGALELALADVRTLRGIVPICASCKKVRDDAGFWQQVEVYVRDHTHAEFSHGLCPECIKQFQAPH